MICSDQGAGPDERWLGHAYSNMFVYNYMKGAKQT